MSFADSTHLLAQLAELRINRDNADVTLNCQGEVIKAHSFILATRCVSIKNNTLFYQRQLILIAFNQFKEEIRKLQFLDFLSRSEYFKTALSTSVGTNNKVLNVDECSPNVLATVVDFIYGIGIPGDFNLEDAKSLLAMADL